MGFLTDGNTLSWAEAKDKVEYVKDHGILQFLAIYHEFKDVEDYKHLWGDEVEFIIAEFNEEGKSVHLSTRGFEVLTQLEHEQGKVNECSWRPEYGVYMVEGGPYSEQYNSLLLVEKNMSQRLNLTKITSNLERRAMIQEKLNKNEQCLAMSHFPRLGCPGFFLGDKPAVKGEIAHSLFIPDAIINPHKRFATLTNNILTRKEKNVIINVPLFQDKNTQAPDYEKLFPGVDPSKIPAKPNHIYADAMAFGMGMCCSQVTFQTKNLPEALVLYDHLLPLGPIMLALTAATPILRGLLSDIDVRWPVIESAVDDRTDEEMKTIPRSRYGPASCYLSPTDGFDVKYNDAVLPINEKYHQQLLTAGVPPLLAQHIAHIFIRDPLVIYDNRIDLNDETEVDHFENIQSSNWQSVRFKPPPHGTSIGWRVEFRTMELMFTDFENAAVVAFICLITRMIQKGYLRDMYMPISQVNENMKTAEKRDSVNSEKFWFRSNFLEKGNTQVSKMSINEIMNGSKETGFQGFIPLVKHFLSAEKVETEVVQKVEKYLDLISGRASGKLMTNATWIRKFVTSHKTYQSDSVVNDEIAYDLLKFISEIEHKKPTEMFGDICL